jgi:hypothetical protein
MQTPRGIRRRAWVMLSMGVLLLGSMTALIVVVVGIISRSGEPGSTDRFDGGKGMAAFVVGILGLVWAFGLTALGSGIWLLRYGRRNRVLLKAAIGLWIALSLVGLVVEFLD